MNITTLGPEVFFLLFRNRIWATEWRQQEMRENLWHLTQDLTLGLRLVDILTSHVINLIGSHDWNYRAEGEDVFRITAQGKFATHYRRG